MIEIRRESPGDISAITAVTEAAFRDAPHTSHTEHFIVNALRAAGQLSISLVATDQDSIVGHIAISPVTLSDDTPNWFGLGPVSVCPDQQGRGIGGMLIRQAQKDLRSMNAAGCVLLGDPAYYSRFGFKPVASLVLPDVPPEYFQALSFDGYYPNASVTYHAAFEATG